MDASQVYADCFARVREHVEGTLDGLSTDDLLTVPEPGANSIGWLLWHLARVEDAQVADLMGRDQVWVEGSWAAGFGLDPDPANHGYGHTPEDVASVQPTDAGAITGYYDAVAARTDELVASLTPEVLDRVVDESWDPPVTFGVRLVSIVDDEIQHAGQAAYVKGLLQRR